MLIKSRLSIEIIVVDIFKIEAGKITKLDTFEIKVKEREINVRRF